MNIKKITILFLFTLTLISCAVAGGQKQSLNYSSFEPDQISVYSGNSTSATLNYTTKMRYDNCSIATETSSLPLGWNTGDPNVKQVNSSGYYQIKTPKVTPIEYPQKSNVMFNLKCRTSNFSSMMSVGKTFEIKNPSVLPFNFIEQNFQYFILSFLLIGIFGISLAKIRDKLKIRLSNPTKDEAEKMSQELLHDLKKRDYTPPEVKRKIKTAQQKIQEEDYEDAVKLLEEADQNLDRT